MYWGFYIFLLFNRIFKSQFIMVILAASRYI